jgi:hypothetical protein
MRHQRRKTIAGLFAAVILAIVAIPLATAAGAAPAKPAAPAQEAPICPSDTANGRLVRWIYLNILFRCPDEGGASYWTAQLDGGMSPWEFARRIDMSDENVLANNVDPIVGDLLGRAPSAAESQQYAASIRDNQGDARLLALLSSSDEYYNNKVTGATPQEKDQNWLNFAYNAILDRDPDPAGNAYFLGILGANGSTQATRHQVAIALEFSGENAEGWIGAVYGAGLHRGPDPDGFAYWKNWLLTTGFRTFRMWTGFLTSTEAQAIAQTQPNPPPEGEPQMAHNVKTL